MEFEAHPRPVPPSLPPAQAPAPRTPPRAAPARGRGDFLRNNIVLVVVIAIVFGIGGVAVATGKPPRPSLDLTSAPAAPASPVEPPTVVPAAATPSGHGTTTVRIGARQVAVAYDGGLVSGLSYGAITIAHPDGSSVTLTISAATRYRPAGVHPKVGERALVYSTGGTARIIASRA